MKASRPWTVYVLVLLGVAGLAWSTLVDPERNLWDVATGLFTLWIAHSLWVGQSWAFTFSFVVATLCGGFFVLYVSGYLLLGHGVQWRAVSRAVWALVEILLLLHPATGKFWGRHKEDQPDAAKV